MRYWDLVWFLGFFSCCFRCRFMESLCFFIVVFFLYAFSRFGLVNQYFMCALFLFLDTTPIILQTIEIHVCLPLKQINVVNVVFGSNLYLCLNVGNETEQLLSFS